MKTGKLAKHPRWTVVMITLLTSLLVAAAFSCKSGGQTATNEGKSTVANQSQISSTGSDQQTPLTQTETQTRTNLESSYSELAADYPPLPSPVNRLEFKQAVITRIYASPEIDDGRPELHLHPRYRIPNFNERFRNREFTIQDLRTMFGFDQVRFYAIEPEKKPITLPVGGGDQTIYAESEVQSINQEVCDYETKLEELMKSVSDNAAIAIKYINYVFLYYLALGHEPPRTLQEIVDLNLLPAKLSSKEYEDVNYVMLNCGAGYNQRLLLFEGVLAANLEFKEQPSFEEATDYVRYKIYAQLPTWGGMGVKGHPELLDEFHEKFVAPYQGTGKLYPRDNMQRLKEWMRSHPTLTINEEFFRLAEQTPWAKEDEWD